MKTVDKFLIGFLLILGFLGLFGKAVFVAPGDNNNAEIVVARMEQAALQTGLIKGGMIDLARQGGYRAVIFRHRECDGAMLVAPLPRNAEAANLLRHIPGMPTKNLFFWLNGKRYETFPDFRFWLAGVMHNLRALGENSAGLLPVVLAVADTGACALSQSPRTRDFLTAVYVE